MEKIKKRRRSRDDYRSAGRNTPGLEEKTTLIDPLCELCGGPVNVYLDVFGKRKIISMVDEYVSRSSDLQSRLRGAEIRIEALKKEIFELKNKQKERNDG